MDSVIVAEKPLLTRVENGVGRLTLNRPEALNALTTGMCRDMAEALTRWAEDDSVAYVVIDHAEGRGFCAGGDIRAAAVSGRGDGMAAREFFRTEYRLNTLIKNFPKPFVAVMDGVVMGGGVGISVHGSHRIATDNTLFAMPETGIGLFPDVGGGWFLPRLGASSEKWEPVFGSKDAQNQSELGTWLALTGARLKGPEVKAAGIATHYVANADLPDLKAELLKGGDIDNILHRYDRPVGTPTYAEHEEAIHRIFGKATLADIAIALKLEDSDWAQHQGEVMATRSPFSMSVTLRQLREGRQMDRFEDVMQMEYRIASRVCQSHDFLEGVRAVLDDKDHSPQWNPHAIGCVSAASVEAVFQPLTRELYD
ncbi:enoyl-CoA hydratase/isomerase family protein [Asticcacaulis sp. YBE204]|uniref:enoyl-CoA hydratase/isomerase family protein n=1 Tax=Asticcacaulis sp. YBE204 TaxID=1282363 RepID=UPI0003C3F221|nr:enoyl-CoA hydratase/isomerase family protein [Asticcacaulis sp. YBE204]ESQ79518.1 enoyl-CoA hydratase [Asticcacaulis sp. YBE204]